MANKLINIQEIKNLRHKSAALHTNGSGAFTLTLIND